MNVPVEGCCALRGEADVVRYHLCCYGFAQTGEAWWTAMIKGPFCLLVVARPVAEPVGWVGIAGIGQRGLMLGIHAALRYAIGRGVVSSQAEDLHSG